MLGEDLLRLVGEGVSQVRLRSLSGSLPVNILVHHRDVRLGQNADRWRHNFQRPLCLPHFQMRLVFPREVRIADALLHESRRGPASA